MARGTIIYHGYVAEPHETAPPPAVQYAYSCVSYQTTMDGISNCEWIIPGTLEQAEKSRDMLRRMRERRQRDEFNLSR